jgi:hypothetical protein
MREAPSPAPKFTGRSLRLRWLRHVAAYLHEHRSEEELRVRRCFKLEPDTWRPAERTVR